MIAVRWPNGRVTPAHGWAELTAEVASWPWNRRYSDIRNELARRAYVWTGSIVDPTLPDEELWRALEGAGLVSILEQPS